MEFIISGYTRNEFNVCVNVYFVHLAWTKNDLDEPEHHSLLNHFTCRHVVCGSCLSISFSLSLCFSFHLLFSRALGDLYAISLVHICALHSCMNFKDFWTWHFRQFLSSTSLKPHLANRCLNDFHLSVDYDYDSTDSHRL